MKNLKDRITNWAGLVVLIAGTILALPTAGVTIPAVVLTSSTISLTFAVGLVAWLTGKAADGVTKISQKE